MTTRQRNGYAFEYAEAGSGQPLVRGEPLVLVHGSASDYRTWRVQQDVFAQYYHTISYSRRYHWPNERIAPGADYSMAEQVDDLEALLRSAEAGPAHLVGHSYGAFVCLLLAMRAPHLVRTLVLTEPPAITLFVSNQPKPGEILRLLLTRPRTALAVLKFGAQGVAPATAAVKRGDAEAALRAFGSAILGRETFEDLSTARLEQARANFIEAELVGSGFAPLDTGRLQALHVPVLLINGQKSPRLFHRLVDRLEELLPDAERVEIPGASHIVHEDNPAAYNRAVLAFLARHSQAPSREEEKDAVLAQPEPEPSPTRA